MQIRCADLINFQIYTAMSFSKPLLSPQADLQPSNTQRPSSRQKTNGASKFSHAAAQIVSHQRDTPNATTAALNSTTATDPNYLSPYKNSGARVPLGNISRSGSEADSLLDLYGRPKSTVDSIEARERTTPQTIPLETTYLDEDPESSKWVHRDKLAMIESYELQEAGIKLPRQSSLRGRSDSKPKVRSGHSRGHSRQQSVNEDSEQAKEMLGAGEGKRQRLQSPVRQGPIRQEEGTPNNDLDTPKNEMNFDLRTPEEIAANPYDSSSSSTYRQQGLRSGSSRIPLPTSSPVPIPQEHRERHTPLTRTRGANGSWDEDGLVYNKSRPRSQSVGSHILLYESGPLSNTPTPMTSAPTRESSSTSPSKQRAISKTVQTDNARKASAALRNVSEQPKARSTSANSRSSPTTRPKSRSGLEARPATAINRPEGEAPWLATMYKPDPRLPPEQQILPTHAKRLQQEQLEQQAKAAGSDLRRPRPFSPVAVHTHNGLQPPSPVTIMSPRDVNEKSPAENQPGWPLKVSPKPSTTNINGGGGRRSPGGASDHGGYTTIPKVQTTPPTGTMSSPRPMAQQAPRGQPGRERLAEKGEQREKGCNCCAVM